MSLKSGLKSISGSAGRGAARRVPIDEFVEPEEESDATSNSEDEGNSVGSQDDDGSDQDAGLALSTGTYAFTPLPLSDDVFEMDGVDEFTPTLGGRVAAASVTGASYVRTRSSDRVKA